jgi:hypothetical protein
LHRLSRRGIEVARQAPRPGGEPEKAVAEKASTKAVMIPRRPSARPASERLYRRPLTGSPVRETVPDLRLRRPAAGRRDLERPETSRNGLVVVRVADE